jgi:hypothetical protein
MKKLFVIIVLVAAAIVWNARPGSAQDKTRRLTERYEYAIVKWDGPDRLFYNMPDKFDLVHLGKSGVKIPGDAQAEEWCLTYAINQMAADGWEPLTLDSRRTVLRRLK